ncbi:MAG: carboxypeptidase regulatory-like domain-containing protein [Chitinispirillaceae bacterium]|nr:carboxypeptidase regulatory-like domain-containing protein [Chitinispirillaceae bacterium]
MNLFTPSVAAAISTGLLFCTSNVDPDRNTPSISVTVSDAGDGSVIVRANVICYDANTNEPVSRAFTGSNGQVRFILSDWGTYYLKVEAQGYEPVPIPGGAPLPFKVSDGESRPSVYMTPSGSNNSSGGFGGYIKDSSGEPVQGVLIVAGDGTHYYSGTSGPDGYYVFYNLPSGTYTPEAHKSGYQPPVSAQHITVTDKFSIESHTLILTSDNGGTVNGHVAFVAAANPDGDIDVTLIHPETKDAVPGLATLIDASNSDYSISGVPYAEYIAWASYRNDGYVMDPDAIRKFGLPSVSLSLEHPDTSVDFKVTGAIKIISPTNVPDSTYPVELSTTSPTFTWVKTSSYSSAKEYIIVVFDSNGRTVWGGFDASGTIRHTKIDVTDTSSVIFNFDGSAEDSLHSGEIYRWKVYADDDRAAGVQTLLSASEDLMGLFKVVEPEE